MSRDVTVRHEIIVPITGELVDAADVDTVARVLVELRDTEGAIRECKAALTEAIVGIASERGTKTLDLDDGTKLSVTGGKETTYDSEAIEQALRKAGMPEERIREIVVETVTYKVAAVEAKRAAGANPKYKRIIERHSTQIETPHRVSVKAPPGRTRGPAKLTEGADS